MCRALGMLVIAVGLASGPASAAVPGPDEDDLVFFESRVRPLLVEKCERCHGPTEQKGALRLDSRVGWETGGDRGPAIEPGDPDASLVIQAVRHADDVKMPPDRPLAETEVATLVEWVRRGAPDPRTGSRPLGGMTLDEARRWWSLQPLTRPPIHDPVPGATTAANPIDAFLDASLRTAGVTPAPPADRRTWIRRATFDLTGLPPSPPEVDAFLADDSPMGRARVVERLLASPAYGERWGRHWLDLVRYADTAGENTDHPVPEAWRYRNWVIDALNRDQPYDEFVRDQIAGDLLAANEAAPEAASRKLVATGYLAIARRFGHDIDKDMHLTFEDVIDNLGKTFLGLTISCARCHSHKYDPITTEDYYALYGVFASTSFPFPGCEPRQQPQNFPPLVPKRTWEQAVEPYRNRRRTIEEKLAHGSEARRAAVGRLQDRASAATRPVIAGEVQDGGESLLVSKSDSGPIAVEVQPGHVLVLSVSPRGNHGADSTQVAWSIRESGADGRTWDLARESIDDLLAGNPHPSPDGGALRWWFLDRRTGFTPLAEPVRALDGRQGLNVWRNGETPSLFVNATTEPISVWTRLAPRSLFVHPAPDGAVGVAWVSPIAGRVEITGRIADAHPGGDGVAWTLEHVAEDVTRNLEEVAEASAAALSLQRELADLVASEPRRELAYAVAEGTPHDVPVQLRGDPEKPGAVVPRRSLEVLGSASFGSAGSGRRELAEWLTDPANPLTARVMVNRVWQHHFGRGLVATPSDLGTRGQPPSHPGLLDWLATDFIATGWSLKTLHRRIILSEAYARSNCSTGDPEASLDPENHLFGRFRGRRLSAEELRDTLLVVGGNLDRSPGDRHPFPPSASWNFTQHNPFADSYPSDRRSVYLMVKRNRRDAFFGLFDGADPNAGTPVRQDTTVPTQALFFLNDPFFHAQADRLADRVLGTAGDPDPLRVLYRMALQREPTGKERTWAEAFRTDYAAELPAETSERESWAALARVLLGSNEFLFVD